MQEPLPQMGQLFRSLSERLIEAIDAEPGTAGWTSAFLDARFTQSGGGFCSKIRALVNGRQFSASPTNAMDRLIYGIMDARGDNPFYGFVLSIEDRRKVDVRLNYDPKYFCQPDFGES